MEIYIKMEARISKIKGFEKVIGGIDLGNILTDGHVYQIINFEGCIMLKDLGPHAIMKRHEESTFTQIMMSGVYLLTEKEYDAELEANGEKPTPVKSKNNKKTKTKNKSV